MNNYLQKDTSVILKVHLTRFASINGMFVFSARTNRSIHGPLISWKKSEKSTELISRKKEKDYFWTQFGPFVCNLKWTRNTHKINAKSTKIQCNDCEKTSFRQQES